MSPPNEQNRIVNRLEKQKELNNDSLITNMPWVKPDNQYRGFANADIINDINKKKDIVINMINQAINEGLDEDKAKGLIANLYHESKLDPKALQGKGSHGVGLAQYSKGSKRHKELIKAARELGESPSDTTFQIKYIVKEALNHNQEVVKNAWLGQKNQQEFVNIKNNPIKAAGFISQKFLRPGGTDDIKAAKQYQRQNTADYIDYIYNQSKLNK